jgi:hypothetical protein
MEPSEPPLKDRNPVMSIIAPIPTSCVCVRKNTNYIYSKTDKFDGLGQGCTNNRRQVAKTTTLLLRWHLIFVNTRYGMRFTYNCWRLEFWVGGRIFEKFVHPWFRSLNVFRILHDGGTYVQYIRQYIKLNPNVVSHNLDNSTQCDKHWRQLFRWNIFIYLIEIIFEIVINLLYPLLKWQNTADFYIGRCVLDSTYRNGMSDDFFLLRIAILAFKPSKSWTKE